MGDGEAPVDDVETALVEAMDEAAVGDEPPVPAKSKEEEALGGKGPLRTLVVQSVGPFVSQLAQALFGFVETIWIEMALGTRGVAALSTYSNFDTIPRAFGFFLNNAASTKISELFGAGRGDEAPQVMADLLRVGVLCAILVPAVLVPCLKPAARWFGADEDITGFGYEYCFPLVMCAFSPIFYLTFAGCLQAEGRTFLFGALQLTTLVLNVGILDPVFLLPLDWKMLGNALATIFAELAPMLVVGILYFCGKFAVRPRFRDLFRKFSPHTFPALRVGLSQLFYQLSLAVPAIVLRKMLGMSAPPGEFNEVVEGYNAQVRFYQVVLMLSAAVTMGFLPCASYAYGASRFRRVLRLLVHAAWIAFLWTAIMMVLTVGVPKVVARVFSDKPDYVHWAAPMLRNSNIVVLCAPLALLGQALLQGLQRGVRASILSFGTQLFPLPLFSVVLFFSAPNAKDPPRLLYAYPIQQGLGVLLAFALVLGPLRDVIRRAREDHSEDGVARPIRGEEALEDLPVGEEVDATGGPPDGPDAPDEDSVGGAVFEDEMEVGG